MKFTYISIRMYLEKKKDTILLEEKVETIFSDSIHLKYSKPICVNVEEKWQYNKKASSQRQQLTLIYATRVTLYI